jgi:transcriptional regulator with GAF, ATPase, and Fis domain
LAVNATIESDYDFFRDAVEHISSSLDLPEAMQTTFDFLISRHFPLDGMCLQRYDPRLKALHLLFLALPGRFFYLDKLIPLSETAIENVKESERCITRNIPHSFQRTVPTLHGKAISAYLPNKDRARLVAFLSTKRRVVGHLSLIGQEPSCFTAEHERKLAMLRPAFSLFMANLLQYHQIAELQNRLAERNRHLVGRLRHLRQNRLIGEEGGLRLIKEMVSQVSGQDVPVLILGETGTGKELVADAIQRISTRSQAPYVKVNCGAIPETLIDSELFGHEKGAFTGATRSRPGRFELADGGTLFLDEIGDMPLNVQVRLLRVLQDGILERVGSSRVVFVDVRIIAATHRNLKDMMQEGRFREDLYYRLNVFPIRMPPLRERLQDIPVLVHHFIAKHARLLHLSNTPRLSLDSLPRLLNYSWPGNVRELENLVARALVLDPRGPLPLHLHLPPDAILAAPMKIPMGQLRQIIPYKEKRDPDPDGPVPQPPMHEWMRKARASMPSLDYAMADHINCALQLCNGKIYGPGGAGELLQINPNTLRKRMDKLGIPYGRIGFRRKAGEPVE